MLDFVQTVPEVGCFGICSSAVQAVPVQHDEYLLLRGGVNTVHGDIQHVPFHRGDARHISCQDLLQVGRSQGFDHLFRYQGDRDRRIFQGLYLLGCGDQSNLPFSLSPHQFGKALRVVDGDAIIGVYPQEEIHIFGSRLPLVLCQVTQCQEAVGADLQCAVEAGQVVVYDLDRLVYSSNLEGFLCFREVLALVHFLGGRPSDGQE